MGISDDELPPRTCRIDRIEHQELARSAGWLRSVRAKFIENNLPLLGINSLYDSEGHVPSAQILEIAFELLLVRPSRVPTACLQNCPE